MMRPHGMPVARVGQQSPSKNVLTLPQCQYYSPITPHIANKHYRGVPHATVIQRRRNQIVMGSCPYCQSVTYTGDTICYTCGRILANIRSNKFAMEQQFHKGSLETSYKMTKKPTKGGVVQNHMGRSVNIMKSRRNRTRHLVLLFLVAFIMLSPQVRENLFEKWAPGVQEYVMGTFAPFHLYPNEATFTLDRTVVALNSNSNGWVTEDIMIPPDVDSLYDELNDFQFTDSQLPSQTTKIQKVESIAIHIDDGDLIIDDIIEIPTDDSIRSFEDKIVTSKGHYVWWPGQGVENTSCRVGNCVKMELHLGPGETAVFTLRVKITSTSYSWWDANRVDSRIAGVDEGINSDNSGEFSDIELRGGGERFRDFTDPTWFDRGSQQGVDHGYAINSQHAIINETASLISANLPEGLKDNAYAFSRATFDYLHEYISYDKNAPSPARSGPLCLEGLTGDCDEQTNAFLSILRTKNIPGWYVFGALSDSEYVHWEGHAWGYILLPMSEPWCNSRNIELNSCFVEASVDVVNNKWLLHTPNAYISWIEEPDSSGNLLNSYYSPARYSNNGLDRASPHYSTVGDVDTSGGLFQVKTLAENLR